MIKSQKGFTLVEIVAALALLGLVAIPLARVFLDSFKFQARSEMKTEVNEVAQFVAEKLKEGVLVNVNEEFSDSESPEQVNLTTKNMKIKSLNGIREADLGDLTQIYDIVIDFKSEQKGEDIKGTTPNHFDFTLTVSNGVTVSDVFSPEQVKVNGNIITIDPGDDGSKTYNFLIVNDTLDKVSYQIEKKTASVVNIYTKGKNGVVLSGPPSPGLSDEVITFRRFDLKDREQVSSMTEDLYNVTITVTSQSDPTITTSMNTTFTRRIE